MDAIEKLEVSTRQWFQTFRQLYLLVTRSHDYLSHFEMFFDTKPLTAVQSAIGAELMEQIFHMVIKTAADKARKEELIQPIIFNVRDMPPEGLAKVHHGVAWAIQKVLVIQRKYVRENMALPPKPLTSLFRSD